MPAWNDHGDDELWATVAFLEKLPGMSEQEYSKLVMQTIMSGGGHHHHGGADSPDPAGNAISPPAPVGAGTHQH